MNIKLAELRNLISNRDVGPRQEKELKDFQKKIINSNSPFSKLIYQSIENCLRDINNNNFDSAAYEIQLIHNLPISESDISKWDESHFYRIELLSYLENVDDFKRIKMLIANVAYAQKSKG